MIAATRKVFFISTVVVVYWVVVNITHIQQANAKEEEKLLYFLHKTVQFIYSIILDQTTKTNVVVEYFF